MTAQTVLQRAFEAFVAHPCGHEMGELSRAAYEWAKEWRTTARPGPQPHTQPAITHGEGSPLLRPQDDFGRRPKPGGGAKIIEGLQDAVAYAQGDVAAAARVRIVPRRRAVEAWEDGPPVDPTIEAGDSA